MPRGNAIVLDGYTADDTNGKRKPIRVWREERGMLQRELAEHLGILRSTISLMESGKVSPSKDQVNTMAALFGVEPYQLLYRISPTNGKRGRPIGSQTRGKGGANYVIDEQGKVWW